MSSTKRLLDRITYKITEGGCWECTSHKARRPAGGYPCFKVGKKVVSGHRLVYEEEKGHISEGLLVRHTCDNKECLNPDHLLIGTYKDNFDDMVERGSIVHLRTGCKGKPKVKVRGESHGNSKITEEQAKEIKIRIKNGQSIRSIGKDMDINRSIPMDISRGKSWGWLEI